MNVICLECQNEFDVGNIQKGDTVECPFCGIELECKNKSADGKVEVEVIEEEK